MTNQETLSPGQAAAMAQLTDGLAGFADEIERQSSQRFAEMLPRVVHRLIRDEAQAAQALQDGGFVMDDATVVMRHNPELNQIEFFCDVGLPQPHATEAVYRLALEMNLCRSHPGVTLGIHPESGRVVATTAMHMMLMADDMACIQALRTLTGIVQHLRAARQFDLVDEEPSPQ